MRKLFKYNGHYLFCVSNSKLKRVFVLLQFLLLFLLKSQAQYPVRVTPQLVGLPSLYLSDYYNPAAPELYIMITNADLQRPLLDVRLRMKIRGAGAVITSKENIQYPSISLPAGLPQRIGPDELAFYFNPSNFNAIGLSQPNKLPAGFYDFCFEAVEIGTGITVGRSECSYTTISLNAPPTLLQPSNNMDVILNDPTNIIFQWSQLFNSLNIANTTEYTFQLVELLDNNISPQDAFLTAQPLYQTTLTNTVLQYGSGEPLLLPGKRYGWRVQARNTADINQAGTYVNNGYSEIFSFTYNERCGAPLSLSATPKPDGKVNLQWQGMPRAVEYMIQYSSAEQPNPAIITAPTNVIQYTITGAVRGELYNYRVGTRCNAGGEIVYSPYDTFRVAIDPVNADAVTGKIVWAFKLSEETADPSADELVSRTKLNDDSLYKAENNTIGNTKYNLQHASVSLTIVYRTNSPWQPNGSTSLTTTTAENGTYNIVIPSQYDGKLLPDATLTISHPSGLFKAFQKAVQLVRTPQGYVLGTDVLSARTLSLKPSVYIPNYNGVAPVSVDVLMAEADWLQYPFMRTAGLGNEDSRCQYNYQSYIVLKTLTDGKEFKKLFYNALPSQNYVIRVNYQDRLAVYYPLNNQCGYINNASSDKVKLLKKSFMFNLDISVEGRITYQGHDQRDVRVKIVINKNDAPSDYYVSPANTSGNEYIFETTSDGWGFYGRSALPPLKTGAIVKISLTDQTIRPEPFWYSVVYDNSEILRKDITIINYLYTVTGRVVDQQGEPVSNASVTLLGSSIPVAPVRTSLRGYYMIKLNNSSTEALDFPRSLEFRVDGFDPVTTTLSLATTDNITTNSGNISPNDWKLAIERKPLFAAVINSFPGGTVTADILGIGTGTLANNFNNYIGYDAELKGVIDAGSSTVQVKKGMLEVKVRLQGNGFLQGNLIKAKVILTGDNDQAFEGETPDDDTYYQKNLLPGRYRLEVQPISGGTMFANYEGEFDIIGNGIRTINVIVQEGAIISGTVTNRATGSPIDSVSINVVGMPYSGMTNAQGKYAFVVPKGLEFDYHFSQKNYNSSDTSFRTYTDLQVNYKLDMRDPNMPQIITMSGFPVQIDKVAAAGFGTYVISGKLTLTKNDIYTPDFGDEKLNFIGVSVKMDSKKQGNAVPLANVAFEEAVISTIAFDITTVEVTGYPQITMKGVKEGNTQNREKGIIGGTSLKAIFGSSVKVILLPIKLKDAEIRSKDPGVIAANQELANQGLKPFAYVYSSPDNPIHALSANQKFNLVFPRDTINSLNTSTGVLTQDRDTAKGHVLISFNFIVDKIFKLYLKDTAEFSKDGFDLAGFVKFNSIISAKMADSGKVKIKKFKIDNEFKVPEFTFELNEAKPWKIGLQKSTVFVQNISILGIGTSNPGVGFGGIWIPTTKEKQDTAIIKTLSVSYTSSGLALAGSFKLTKKGLSVKGIVFKTPGAEDYLSFSLDPSKSSYKIEAAGILDYNKEQSSTTPSSDGGSNEGLKAIFPIEIQKFSLDLGKWNLFLAARANITKDFKVVKISVTNLLISIGYNKTLDEMNTYLTNGEVTENTFAAAGPEDQPLEEANASWAIGINGGLSFPPTFKGMSASGSGSFLIGNVNNKIEVRMNEIEIHIIEPALEVLASVKLGLSADKIGFEAAATIVTIKRTFEAKFKFYKIPSGIILGADLTVAGPFTTGPIVWHSIGGGFDFNTAEQKYTFKITGDAGLAGTTKEVGYLKDATLKLIFDGIDCDGWPVVEFEGTLMMKDKERGKCEAVIDFCKSRFMIKVSTTIPVASGIDVYVTGLFFCIARKINNVETGSMLLGVNANLTSMGDILKGNIRLVLGINYNNNDQYSPQETRDWFNYVDNDAKDYRTKYENAGYGNLVFLNGLYISGTTNVPEQHASFDLTVNTDGGNITLLAGGYDFKASASAQLIYKPPRPLSPKDYFFVRVQLHAEATAYLTVLMISLGGSGTVDAEIQGGYDGSAWYLNGNADMKVAIWGGINGEAAGCNDYVTAYYRTCTYWKVDCCQPCWDDCDRRVRENAEKGCFLKCTDESCVNWPYGVGFKGCFGMAASFDYRQGQSTKISFSKF
ncbi:MAG: carboxypeptidase-like regulatory domain-containing protein [Ferruginibacter sp.]